MKNIPILTIKNQDEIVLQDTKASQIIEPIFKTEIKRSLSSKIILAIVPPNKHKSIIETSEIPEICNYDCYKSFTVFSIVKFCFSQTFFSTSILLPYLPVPGSIETPEQDKNIIIDINKQTITTNKPIKKLYYRPIFNMKLINFSCQKKSNTDSWRLEMEEP